MDRVHMTISFVTLVGYLITAGFRLHLFNEPNLALHLQVYRSLPLLLLHYLGVKVNWNARARVRLRTRAF